MSSAHPLCRHAGLVEIRTIPAKKDIAFVEFTDEGAATVAKEALHNFKIDGETKMKVSPDNLLRGVCADPALRSHMQESSSILPVLV